MLSLVGMGLTLKDLTLKGLEEIKQADQVFVELYTSVIPEFDKNKVEKTIGKKIRILEREDLEQRSNEIIQKAKNQRIVLLVPGDPLIATTHVELILEAKKQNIKTKIIHAPSIFTAAIGELGLQIYKFSQPCSIPLPEKGFRPETFYQILKNNRHKGLHTLFLLDINLTPNQALEILLNLEKKRKQNAISENTLAIVLSRIGSKNQKIIVEKIRKLIKYDFGTPPHTLIIPGELHFKEKEFLSTLK